MNDYVSAELAMSTARNRSNGKPIGNNTRLVETENGLGVKLHDTVVVEYYTNGSIVLNSGGWKTSTTKNRIDEYTPSRIWIYQDKGAWYVKVFPDVSHDWSSTPTYHFADEMVIHGDGSVYGAEEYSKEAVDATRKLRKSVNAYAKRYVKALFDGDVPRPSNGDCFGCLFVSEDGSYPLGGGGHIESHIEEDYYVPSLLVNAVKAFQVSPAAQDCVARLWAGEEVAGVFAAVGATQLTASIRRHCFKELGMVR